MNDTIKAGIASVIAGNLAEFEDGEARVAVRDAEALVTELGFEIKLQEDGVGDGEFSTNGWQYDWWINCFDPKTPEAVFCIHGSGYYGGFTFSKAD